MANIPNITDVSINVLRNTNYVFKLLNDIDFYDISGTPFIEIITTNSKGSAATNGNICQYQPLQHSNDNDSFQYFIQTQYDGQVYTSETKTVNITINYITLGENIDQIDVYSSISIDNNITSLVIDPAVYIINERTFLNNHNIQKINGKNVALKTIKREAFYFCENLYEIEFDDIEEMEDSAFHNTNLNKIIINNIEYNIGATELKIPNGITELKGKFEKNSDIINTVTPPIILPNSAITYKYLRDLFLPESLTHIGDYIFFNRYHGKMEKVVISKNVVYIGWGAFFGHPISSVLISNNLNNIRHAAINGAHLRNLYIYNLNDNTINNGNIGLFTKFYYPEVEPLDTFDNFASVLNSGISTDELFYSNYIQNQITAQTFEDTSVNINLQGENDSENTVYNIVVNPAGNYTINDNIINYVPLNNYDLIDSMSVLKINENISEIVLIYINVISVNDRPSVSNIDNLETPEDIPLNIVLQGQDIEDETIDLSYSIVVEPSFGIININKNIATYIPNLNYYGPDSFTYNATDISGMTSLDASVSINVIEVNDPPVVQNLSGEIFENTDISFLLTVVDSDIIDISENFSFQITKQPDNGIATITNNILYYIPNTDFFGNELIQYISKDARDLSSNIGNINIIINDTPPPPVFPIGTNIDVTTLEDDIIRIDLKASYNNNIINDASFIIMNEPLNGIVKYSSFNQLSYKPNFNYLGNDSITYKVIYDNKESIENYVINIKINEKIFSKNNGCRKCPPKVIFTTTNTTYHNKSFRKTFYEINTRDTGSCFNLVRQEPRILPILKNKF